MGGVPVGSSARHNDPVSTLIQVIRNPFHLARRFFTSLPATPPPAADEVWVDRQLLDHERSMWVQFSNQDRRHSIGVARRFADARPGASRAEIAGALLHDIGKIECGLGTFSRVCASLVGPRTERYRIYHDHEEIGARLAASGGSAPETVQLIAGEGLAYEQLKACDY